MDISPWRDASRPLTIFGIPALLLPVYFAWFRWPSFFTLAMCTFIILFFKLISIFGYSLPVMIQRGRHKLRGNPVLGHSWGVQKFFE